MADYIKQTKDRMKPTLSALQTNLNTLRSGRASPAVLENIQCDYYGEKMPISSIAAIKIPEPRQLLIVPYDKGDVKTIVAAINASQLGINPLADGDQVRLTFPAPTQERRLELQKKAKAYGEDAKVALRNIRRDELDALKKSDGISEDFQKRYEGDIQKATDEMIAEVDKMIKEKNAEIMEI